MTDTGQTGQHGLKKEFTVERDGKTFVLYAGLLDMAHTRGLKAITTTLVQIPNELNGNVAICHATVEIEQGTFTGIGDAAPTNVNRMMAPHLIRMAETRAKARALRDAVNVGVTAVEELSDGDSGDDDLDDHPAVRQGRAAASNTPRQLRDPEHLESPGFEGDRGYSPRPTAPAQRAAGPAPAGGSRGDGPAATPKQLETIARMARASGQNVATDGLTRAQASEIISNLIGQMGEQRASHP
jgi:hypothetical protein